MRLFPQAILAGASTQLRNAATTAGNLLQRTRCVYFRNTATPCNKREPGSGCPAITGANRMMAILGTSEACIASNPSDMAVAMLAYDATVHVQGVSGVRSIALKDFFLLPQDRSGQGERARARGPDHACHRCPRGRPASGRSTSSCATAPPTSLRWCPRPWPPSYPTARSPSIRFALGGVGTRPWRVPDAEQALIGQAPTEQNFRRAADLALAGAKPQSQNGFKVELAKRCVVETLKRATR